MRTLTVSILGILLITTCQAWAQTESTAPAKNPAQPLYRVTIVSRTTKAINYGYLSGPTRIGFAGTPLLTGARGEATVEPERGATQINARFSNVPPPTQFGPQYLTYVVWAISPDGRAQNLGELTLDGSNKGKLSTSTPFQTFALIVTAEPYYSVTQPSDAVVMENVVQPGTVGKVEEVNATYELLPRGHFTYDTRSQPQPAGKPVSKEQYDAIVALYQAQNAIQIAESQHAEQYAAERLARARQIYQQARSYPSNLSKEIVSMAREATQVAEDARAIAAKRYEQEQAAAEEQRLAQERKITEAQRAAAEAERDRARVEAERLAATQPDTRSRVMPTPSAPRAPQGATAPQSTNQPPISVDSRQFDNPDPHAGENRARLLAALRGVYDTTDSPRGIVITVPDAAVGTPAFSPYMSRIASAIAPYRSLHVEVDAHSDRSNDVVYTERRAELVRRYLIAAGVPPGSIVTRGFGDTRPRTSNESAAGRAENRRVEIVISGDAVGNLPSWDRTYNISRQ